MTIESVSFIDDLDSNYPAADDNVYEGDDHIRNIKIALLASLPNISAAVTVTHTELNALANIVGNVETRLAAVEVVAAAGEFETGVNMLFNQATAPTGWTIDTSVNDKVVMFSNGSPQSGGSWTISGITVDGHAITISEMPAHTHDWNGEYSNNINAGSAKGTRTNVSTPITDLVASTGGGNTHTHDLTIGSSWRPAYQEIIAATKDA